MVSSNNSGNFAEQIHFRPEVAVEHGGTPSNRIPGRGDASRFEPRFGRCQTVAVRQSLSDSACQLGLLHRANVVGCGSSLRNRTTRRILREIVEFDLLVRKADTLGGYAL